MTKILALDFDGVFADTKFETGVNAINTYIRFNPDTNIFGGKKYGISNVSLIETDYAKELKKYYEESVFANSSKENTAIIMAMDKGIPLNSQDDFNEFFNSIPVETQDLFQKNFYEGRYKLMENIAQWLKLAKPYDDVIESVKRLTNETKAFILTNKDKKSVLKVCESLNLSFKKSDISDKDNGLDKASKIKILAKKNSIPVPDILFVDDNFENLLEVKPTGAKCFLASWGYNNDSQRKEAVKKGITILTRENFYETIKGEL